jgi:hypothetical protein
VVIDAQAYIGRMEGKVVVAICAPVLGQARRDGENIKIDAQPVLILNAISSN